jgi:dihydrofolate reductase/thymidylate synthase
MLLISKLQFMSKLINKINVIVAVDKLYGISKNGQIPWNFKKDFKWFKNTTQVAQYPYQKNALIMGRKTFETIPEAHRPLPERYNIIVSSTLDNEVVNKLKDTFVSRSLSEAIDFASKLKDVGKIFAIGGSSIYKETFDLYHKRQVMIDNVYVTHIDDDYQCDNYFKNLSDVNNNRFEITKSDKFTDVDTISKKEVSLQIEQFTNMDSVSNWEVDTRVYVNGCLHEEYQYLNILQELIDHGDKRKTRNAITYSMFGKKMEFDLSKGFPLITTKKVFMRGVFEELVFFLKGDTNTLHLEQKGVNIWRQNTSREFLDSVGLKDYAVGDMGNMYGFIFKYYAADYKGCDVNYTGQGIDQIDYCLDLLKKDPYSRRIIMTSYDVSKAPKGCLFPCHGLCIQWYVEKGHRLSCSMTQRSVDWGCGLPFNLASYSLWIHIFCELLNNDIKYTGPKFIPGKLIMFFNDLHIYEEHIDLLKEQIKREPYHFPQLSFKKKFTNISQLEWTDINLENYKSHPAIPLKMVA